MLYADSVLYLSDWSRALEDLLCVYVNAAHSRFDNQLIRIPIKQSALARVS